MRPLPLGDVFACIVVSPSYRSGTDSAKSVGGAMQQIADWLEKLGMSEYAERFGTTPPTSLT